jgi:hypothetical protein
MKTLSASLLVLLLAGPGSLMAQAQTEKAPLSDSSREIIQAWSGVNRPSEARIEGDRLILPSGDRDNTCAFLRVYRMKRDVPCSDQTRPAGYTTCVRASRFTMKSSVIQSADPQRGASGPAR